MDRQTVPQALRAGIKNGRLFHSYIIDGGGEELARFLAAAAVCSSGKDRPCGTCPDCIKAQKEIHPDIITVRKNKKEREISVGTVRDVRADAFVLPNEAERKVYIIEEADSMNIAAQNAMLKILEEPPKFVVFILLARNPERLLPTVRSRCVEIAAAPEKDGAAGETASGLASLIKNGDKEGIFRALIKLDRLQKEEFGDIITQTTREILLIMRENADAPAELKHAADVFGRAREYLDANVSLIHITGMLTAELSASEGEKT